VRRKRAEFYEYAVVKAAHAPNIAKVLLPILNACGAARDIVDETWCLDSQVPCVPVDGALDIEVAVISDDGFPATHGTGQNRRMLYILKVGLQTQDGCWHNVSTLTVCFDLCVGQRSWPSNALSMTKR
jgi:hypothetical protein